VRTPAITIFVVVILIIGLALAVYDYKTRGARQERIGISKTESDTLKDTRLSGDEAIYNQDYSSAIQKYSRALRISPRDAYLHNDLGTAYYHLGLDNMDVPMEEDDFSFGMEVDARYVEDVKPITMVKEPLEKTKSGIITVVVNNEADSDEIEDNIRSMGHFVHAEAEESEDGSRDYWLTIIVGKTKELFLEAETEYLKAIDIKSVKDAEGRKYSNYSTASRNLGTLYFRMGKKKEAVRQWQRALQLEPTDSELRSLLGGYEK